MRVTRAPPRPWLPRWMAGRRVAARHGATFVDLDEHIEREAGARIPEVFASEGEAGFRRAAQRIADPACLLAAALAGSLQLRLGARTRLALVGNGGLHLAQMLR